MNNLIPRVAAVHDISCFGRCSLTVIIPTLSALGVQVCPLPTAVLSTHLGGFSGMEFYDFTNLMTPFFQHWQREKIEFDCIYSGFLASERQIAVVNSFIEQFSHNKPLILVDPVMGDEGKLYSTYTPEMQAQMKLLVQKADIITPNYTEACFLLGEQYKKYVGDEAAIGNWVQRLSALGPRTVVISGVPIVPGKLMNIGYDKASGLLLKDYSEHIPVKFPGTGDIYASVLLGVLLKGKDLAAAMKKSAEFVKKAIKITYEARAPRREGVLLERVLPELLAADN